MDDQQQQLHQIIEPPRPHFSDTHDIMQTFATDAIPRQEKIVPLLDIPVKGVNGIINLLILIDTGSGDSYIARSVLNKLKYRNETDDLTVKINTLHGEKHITTKAVTITNIRDDEDIELKFYVTDNMINFRQDPETPFLDDDNLNSAMKRTHTSLDAIIGVDQLCHFVSHMHPVEQQRIVRLVTPYGITYGGYRPTRSPPSSDKPIDEQTQLAFATDKYTTKPVPMDTLVKAVNKLCEIESMPHDGDETGLTMEEKEAIKRVQTECILDPQQKRFVSTLLLKKPTNLANNYYRALAHARTLHKKNLKDPAVKKVLKDRMKEFLTLDIARRIHVENPDKVEGYYSPQRLVHNAQSSTTPYRLTSNASASTSVDESLNTNMLQTPVPVLRIAQLALQNRRHKFIISFDIRKMYVQIIVHPDDRKWVRFIWLDPDEEDPKPEIWEFKRLIWGLACSAFISGYCIDKLIDMALEDPDLWSKNVTTLRNYTIISMLMMLQEEQTYHRN